MIISLILILCIIIFIALFVGKNLTNVCTFWFFKTYTQLSVTVIVFISFAAGIVLALLIFLLAKINRVSRDNEIANIQETAQKEQKKREKIIKKHQKKIKTSVESSSEQSDKIVDIEDKIHE